MDFSNHAKINEIIASHDSYILFPSEDALNLSDTKPQSKNKKIAIFLIDSTWACTKKMFTQSTNLQKLKHMSFTTTEESRYEIKEQPNARYLSTIESTLVVLKALNKHKVEAIQEESLSGFLNPFLEMVAYQKKLIDKGNAVRFRKKPTC
ncbi:MAG: tRNA-uridine aminocarboxypropyltransferase [Sulfurimonas sp.]|nr:tRNA-uridine aminocarboxypropyltransferase [Sulfurimonas sp.]